MTIVEISVIIAIATGIIWALSVLTLALGLGRLAQASTEDRPTVALLVAARNEEQCIADCLDSLIAQDYPSDLLEVVVINDSSEDRTADIVKQYAEYGVRLLEAGHPSEDIAPKKNALMTGIRETEGEIIVVTDADCTPPKGWISGIIKQFTAETDAVVGFSPLHSNGLVGAICRFDGFINAVVSAGTIGLNFPTTAVGRNFAYRRAVWESVDGFGDTAEGASGDDDLLLQRISANGGKVTFSTDPATFVPATSQSSISAWMRMKRRHWSAGTRYKADMIALSNSLYLFNLLLLVTLYFAVTGELAWWITLSFWGAKGLTDYITLSSGARKLHVRRWRLSWLVGELISPLLIVVLLPLSLGGKVNWKERELKR